MARIPFRTQVVIGGVPLSVLTWDAERHAYSGADSCTMELALSSTPDLMAVSQEMKGDSQKPLELQIFGGYVNPAEFGPPKLDLIFDGIVDSLDGDWNDDAYHIGVRSWAYLLMTAKTTAIYPNTVASEVARTIAAKQASISAMAASAPRSRPARPTPRPTCWRAATSPSGIYSPASRSSRVASCSCGARGSTTCPSSLTEPPTHSGEVLPI